MEERLKHIERYLEEQIVGSGGMPGQIVRKLKKQEQEIEELKEVVEGDENTPGLNSRVRHTESKIEQFNIMSLKINGDGTDSNRGLLSRFEATERITQTAKTTATTVSAFVGLFGFSLIGFFWNDLQTKHAEHRQSIIELDKRIQILEKDLASNTAKSEERNRWAERIYQGEK